MKGRQFEDASSLANIARIRSLLRRSRKGLTVKELAVKLSLTERRTRDYLRYLLHGGVIYVAAWEDGPSRGKKLARFLLRKGNEQDAQKWWLECSH